MAVVVGVLGCVGQDVGVVRGRKSRGVGRPAHVGTGLRYGRSAGNWRVPFGRGIRRQVVGSF